MRDVYDVASQLYIIVLHVQDVETVVGDISVGIQQLKNLSVVRLMDCCDELTRGVVGGVVVSKFIQEFIFGTYFSESTCSFVNVLCMYCVCIVATAYTVCVMIFTPLQGKYSEEIMKSLENIKNSKNLRDFTLELRQLPSHYMASIVCGCFQSRTLEKLMMLVEEVRV